MSDFRTPERKQIASQLYKIAERLKILINKNLAVMMSDFTVSALKLSEKPVSIVVFVAERQANLEALRNHGQPTRQSLVNLRNAYRKVGNSFMAAETY